MSDELLEEFEHRVLHLVGINGRRADRSMVVEYSIGDLHMMVSTDLIGLARTGFNVHLDIAVWDSDGMIFSRHYIENRLTARDEDLKKVEHYVEVLRRAMVLDAIAEV